ncbi:MAG: sugar ABC transporter ATP-binding protein [Acetobacteraceae bacterium]|nr:sugar ABC transporter ATP-binding protein [Acetobacteraceae bacterium]
MSTPRLSVRGLGKTFPGVRALDDVSLEVAPGEVHALLGENGAGKSTLGKIVAGVYAADAGEIRLDGAKLDAADEADAAARGIGIVHQEGSLVPQLSIAENIFAGRPPTSAFGRLDRRAMRARADAILRDLGLAIDARTRVGQLSPAQAQVVEIAKALSRPLRLLILDEPTAALTLTETDRLFDAIRRVASSGVAVIYVSHRLAEIFRISQRVTVLKDGRVTGTRATAATTEDELIRLMIGRDVHLGRAPPAPIGDAVLQARALRAPAVAHADLVVRRGEIVCLAGLIGAGRSELCETLFGARPLNGGAITVNGRAYLPAGPWDAMAAGIGMVPEDRKDGGLFLGMDVAANIAATVLGEVSRAGIVSRTRADALAQRFVRELRIATPSVRQHVGNLSGGNQQKVLLAKWLAARPALLIVDEPTRGVDVGSRAEIYRLLRELARDGLALLVVSSDLPEVLALADRIVVMADGRTVGELPGDGATEEAVLRLATRFTRLDATPAPA